MDWIMLAVVLVTGPTFAQSQSHHIVNFTSGELCTKAADQFKNDLEKPGPGNLTVTVRVSCAERKAAK